MDRLEPDVEGLVGQQFDLAHEQLQVDVVALLLQVRSDPQRAVGRPGLHLPGKRRPVHLPNPHLHGRAVRFWIVLAPRIEVPPQQLAPQRIEPHPLRVDFDAPPQLHGAQLWMAHSSCQSDLERHRLQLPGGAHVQVGLQRG